MTTIRNAGSRPTPRTIAPSRLSWVLHTSLLVLMTAAMAASLNAATLTLESDSPTVTPGEPLTLTVTIDGLTAADSPSLGTFDVTLSFDPALLGLDSDDITFSGFLGSIDGGEAAPFVVLGDGSIEIAALSVLTAGELNALQGETFQLFEAELRVSGSQSVTLMMAASALGDGEGNALALDAIAPLELDVADGVVFADGFEGGTTGAWTASVP